MSMGLNTKSRQDGAVLFIALIMLLVLTIIGLTSIRGTSLQEGMAGNLREINLSFQAAEAGLRAGEQLAHNRFLDGSLELLQPLETIDDTYSGLADLAAPPAFSITKLAGLRTSTEAGVSINEEGVLVRINSRATGIALDNNENPTTVTELRSTYLVEQ